MWHLHISIKRGKFRRTNPEEIKLSNGQLGWEELVGFAPLVPGGMCAVAARVRQLGRELRELGPSSTSTRKDVLLWSPAIADAILSVR